MSTTPLPDFAKEAFDNITQMVYVQPLPVLHIIHGAHVLKSHIQTQAERIAELEAELALVREWARGRCVCCAHYTEVWKGPCQQCRTLGGVVLDANVWTPAWAAKGE